MASRTIFSNTCFKPSFISAKKNILSNRTTIFPSSQASRQATTTSILDTSTTQGRIPSFQLCDYPKSQRLVHLVKFTSIEGKRLFRNAMIQGHAESFFKLMGNFSTQSSPSHGGVSSRKLYKPTFKNLIINFL